MPRSVRSHRPRWFAFVQAGDVLRTRSGDFRLVRDVLRHKDRLYISFAIRRCSWTKRPYTVYVSGDTYLRQMTWVGKYRGKLTALDRRIQREINDVSGRRRCGVTCCQARGLP